jgi:sugar-specific transcriptional regulator TrmB
MDLLVLYKVFEANGLSEFDADLYLELVQTQKFSITSFATKYSCSRVRVYNSLTNLQKNELITISKKPNSKITPLSPQSLLSKMNYQQNEIQLLSLKFKQIIPEITGQKNMEQFGNKTEYFGKSKMFELMQKLTDSIESGGELLSFNETEEFDYFFRDYFFGEQSRQRAKRSVKVRILFCPKNFNIEDKLQKEETLLRSFKFLPKNFCSESTYSIFGSSMMLWNLSVPKAFLVTDQVVISTMKAVFESFWSKD